MKKTCRSTLSAMLSVSMLAGMFTAIPLNAGAAGGISYIYRSWDGEKVVDETRSCTDYSSLANGNLRDLWSGWYVVDRSFTLDNRLTCHGEVNIILCDDCTMTLKAGITVAEGDTLNIFGQANDKGKIYSHPDDDDGAEENAAVIGGTESSPSAGTINIYGGTLDLKTPSDASLTWDCKAACIGGGYGDEGEQDGYAKSISIYGGDITCKSGPGGAAIGGGKYGSAKGIYIYGGKIDAASSKIGNDGGAAIGSGYDAPHAGDTIRIYGGDIKARASTGAAIGSGDKTDSNSIVITGGTIFATATVGDGSSGAAIGSGRGGRAHPISISDAAVIAVSSSGAAIGSGEKGPANGVSISGSVVLAESMQGGAGIGSGYKGDCGDVSIENSIIFADAKEYKNTQELVNSLEKIGSLKFNQLTDTENAAALQQKIGYAQAAINLVAGMIYFCTPDRSGSAIGSGVGGDLDSIRIARSYVKADSHNYSSAIGSGEDGDFSLIEITDSEIYATSGDYGAAIGSGDEAEKCGTITINNSTVTAEAGTDAAGIGTGNETDQSATINITGSTVTAHGGRYAAGIGGGDAVSGGTINITDSTISEADSKTDGAGIGGGEDGSGGTITIANSNVTAHGGGYAAGIGGGDNAGGGTININNSSVRAYGGTDAAGIGGGEGGSGGPISIYNSNVYAQGK
ncbi:MAG: hypothetical protein IJH94_06380, partial [Clostridia bacterium]|nr:hypothetical protein [Clostridia bacterium]